MGWMKGFLPLPAGSTYQMRFEAMRGVSFKSDIALDDISVSRGKCAYPG